MTECISKAWMKSFRELVKAFFIAQKPDFASNKSKTWLYLNVKFLNTASLMARGAAVFFRVSGSLAPAQEVQSFPTLGYQVSLAQVVQARCSVTFTRWTLITVCLLKQRCLLEMVLRDHIS